MGYAKAESLGGRRLQLVLPDNTSLEVRNTKRQELHSAVVAFRCIWISHLLSADHLFSHIFDRI